MSDVILHIIYDYLLSYVCFHKTEVNGFTTFMIHDSLGLNEEVGVYFLLFGLGSGFEVSFF